MITKIRRKTFTIRPSGRSTDFISPSFGHGCLYNCSYCYMKRHKPKDLNVATNTGDILTAINNHAFFTPVDKPNQTHSDFTTYDISCNEDYALHAKHHDWKKTFEFFKDHPIAMGSFATKYVNPDLTTFDPEGKIRIRFSLMPQKMADIHEPHTSKIINRIKAIDAFIDSGYDVHVNFSPVVVYKGWEKDYEELFQLRNILGTYIIISLDFLIVSDIIHSVVKPELSELLNLGIIVVMRTAIGYFLGKELHELRKELKVEESEEDAKKQH